MLKLQPNFWFETILSDVFYITIQVPQLNPVAVSQTMKFLNITRWVYLRLNCGVPRNYNGI